MNEADHKEHDRPHEAEAKAIIEAWKNKGVTHVYIDPTRGRVEMTGHKSWERDIDTPEVLDNIITSLGRGNKYKLD